MLKQPEFVRVPFGKIQPWDKNPRGIKQKELEALAKSITEFGQFQVLTCWPVGKKYSEYPDRNTGEYMTGGGNMRWHAMKKVLHVADDFPIWVSLNFPANEADRIKLALRDNQRFGFYEEDKLAELVYPEIQHLDLTAFKVDLGEALDLKQVVERFGPDIDDGADEVPEVDDTPAITKPGDLFKLGKHRLLCGDCTKDAEVKRLLAGQKIDMVFTDPPYGVSYADKNEMLNAYDKGNRIQKAIVEDHVSEKDIQAFWKRSFTVIRDNLAAVNSYYITGPQIQGMMMMMMMQESGLPYRHVIIWVKNNHVLGRCDYNYRHEPIFFGWTNTHRFYGNGKFKTSVWEVDKPLKNDLHPTMKPVALPECAMLNSSADGAIVFDGFLGSGTTLIAAEKTGRSCYGMEIDPKYCDVIIKRYADFTSTTEESIRATVEHGE